MTLHVQLFWHDCDGLKDLSVRSARQLQLLGKKAVADCYARSVTTKLP